MADWSPWVSMAFDDEEMADNASPSMPEQPQFPYGLRICLCGSELEKLELPMPDKGDMLHIRAMAVVTSISDGDGGQRVEMQIVAIRLEDEDRESTSSGAKDEDDE